jgi:translation initiation factor IF-3
MKVKVALRFRGREMAHTEFGFQVIQKFLVEIAPYGHQDFEPKLVGRSINLMISPLPRNKRAKNPRQSDEPSSEDSGPPLPKPAPPRPIPAKFSNPANTPAATEPKPGGFTNNPFSQLNIKSE